MKNIYLALMDYMDNFSNGVKNAINSYYEQNPDPSYEEVVEVAKAATVFNAKEIYGKRQSLAIESARTLGMGEEEISAMIQELQNSGWTYYPSIVEDIKYSFTHDVKIAAGEPDEYIEHHRIPDDLLYLTPDVANFIYQKVSSEPKYSCVSIDNGLSR